LGALRRERGPASARDALSPYNDEGREPDVVPPVAHSVRVLATCLDHSYERLDQQKHQSRTLRQAKPA